MTAPGRPPPVARRDRRPVAVVFDFDGVIVDSEPYWGLADQTVIEDEGAVFRPESKKLVMGLGELESIRRLLDLHGLDLPPKGILAKRERLMERFYAERIPLMDGARHVLEALRRRDFPVALASSTPARLIRVALRRFDLERLLRVIVVGADVECGKPAPDIYLRAARELDVDPTAVMAVEDSVPGIRSARAAGMIAVWLRNTYAPEAETEAHHTIARVPDLLDLLDTLV